MCILRVFGVTGYEFDGGDGSKREGDGEIDDGERGIAGEYIWYVAENYWGGSWGVEEIEGKDEEYAWVLQRRQLQSFAQSQLGVGQIIEGVDRGFAAEMYDIWVEIIHGWGNIKSSGCDWREGEGFSQERGSVETGPDQQRVTETG